MPKQTINDLIRAFAHSTGNKVYLRDVEQLFEEKLADLTPQECDTLRYLIRDLKGLGNLQDKVNRMKREPWRGF